MGIPSYADLGKNARNVFTTGYHQGKGLIKFNVKTKSLKRFQLMSDTTLNFEATKLNGLMETKYKTEGGALLLKWTTDGTLSLGYEFHVIKDVDWFSECSYNPESAAKSVKIGAKYCNNRLNAHCDVSNDLNASTSFLGSFVVKCGEFLMGYRAGYDTAVNQVTKNDISLACELADVNFHLRCTCIPYEYGLSAMYKVNPDIDIAANGIFARRGNTQKWIVGAGAKYKLDDKSTMRFKFNTDLQLATSFLQKLNDGVTLILSFSIDCANIIKGGHRVGLAFNVEA